MTWFRIDDSFASHYRVTAAGNAAIGLWARAGAWSMGHLTDGFIPTGTARSLGKPAEIKALVTTGLWLEVDGGYSFFRWAEDAFGTKRQETREEAEARRRGARDRQTKRRTKASDVTPQLPPEPDVTPDVTRDSRVSHGPVTRPSSSSSSITPAAQETGAQAPAVPAKDRRTRIPDDFDANDAHRRYAHEHHLDLALELQKFRDNARMNGRLGIDWSAGFRNWLVKSAEFAAARPKPKADPDAWMQR